MRIFLLLILASGTLWAQAPSTLQKAREVVAKQKQELAQARDQLSAQANEILTAKEQVLIGQRRIESLDSDIAKEREEKNHIIGQRDWWQESYQKIEGKYSNLSGRVNKIGFVFALAIGAIFALGVGKISALASIIAPQFAWALPVTAGVIGFGLGFGLWSYLFRAL
jgi:hypothetical protein